MQKIDFFGGLHGNYLELVVNVAINQIEYDITKPQFTEWGACHNKNKDSSYKRMVLANHFSYLKVPFSQDDIVVRIVPTENDVLIAITNSFLRAGDQPLDIDSLEEDTINKLTKFSKGANFAGTITQDYGQQVDYPRSAIRNYFYSMLDDYEHGLGMFTNFAPAQTTHNFPFRALFDLGHFYRELNEIAKFLGLNFYPTVALGSLHSDFLKYNQGYHSEVKCKKIWDAILLGESRDIKLNLVEEAWINYQVARCFRCYDHPLLTSDRYPTNTLEISKAIFDWKSTNR